MDYRRLPFRQTDDDSRYSAALLHVSQKIEFREPLAVDVTCYGRKKATAGNGMPTAHLVFGFLGSGKTTLAKRLELQHSAVRFTPDEWMARLFGEDPPADTFQDRAAAIVDLMQPIWVRCLSLGLDVVLDYGFWSRAERDRVRATVEKLGATPVLWAVSCSDDEARKRIALRNEAAHRSLYITSTTFDLLKARVEPLAMDEVHSVA